MFYVYSILPKVTYLLYKTQSFVTFEQFYL